MTKAPTPDEVHALAARLEHCVAKWGKQNALSLEAYSSVKMLRRLLAENERMESERITRIDQQTKLSLRIVDLQAENERLRAGLEPRKPLTEAEANALWATCLQKHKRPGPFELIQEFCATGPLPGIAGGSS